MRIWVSIAPRLRAVGPASEASPTRHQSKCGTILQEFNATVRVAHDASPRESAPDGRTLPVNPAGRAVYFLLEAVVPSLVRVGQHPQRHVEIDFLGLQKGCREVGAQRRLHVDALFHILRTRPVETAREHDSECIDFVVLLLAWHGTSPGIDRLSQCCKKVC
jgi:hypothetical protein